MRGSPPRQVNKLDSVKTQLPYRYYDLPFCAPAKEALIEDTENLGEILSGDVIETSKFEVRRVAAAAPAGRGALTGVARAGVQLLMKVDETCKFVCEPQNYEDAKLADFADKIEDEYRVNMIVDNLPAATKVRPAAARAATRSPPAGQSRASLVAGAVPSVFVPQAWRAARSTSPPPRRTTRAKCSTRPTTRRASRSALWA